MFYWRMLCEKENRSRSSQPSLNFSNIFLRTRFNFYFNVKFWLNYILFCFKEKLISNARQNQNINVLPVYAFGGFIGNKIVHLSTKAVNFPQSASATNLSFGQFFNTCPVTHPIIYPVIMLHCFSPGGAGIFIISSNSAFLDSASLSQNSTAVVIALIASASPAILSDKYLIATALSTFPPTKIPVSFKTHSLMQHPKINWTWVKFL